MNKQTKDNTPQPHITIYEQSPLYIIDENGNMRPVLEKMPEYQQALADIKLLREALKYISEIEKPMISNQPVTDWLSWYSTSSQQSEAAAEALESIKGRYDV